MANPKFIKASYNEKLKTVEYVADNGDRLLRKGGTIAWRFNNPGNLRPGSKYKLHIGQGHTASGVFLIFPTPEAGREEKKGLLLRKYKEDTISQMLYTYAPPSENDTEGYINSICKKTGFSRDRIIGQFSDDEMKKLMTAMEEHEGYHHKKETREEIWVRATTIGFSDGARPIADMPVKIKRGNEETLAKTNTYGQLAPFVHLDAGESVELWIKGAKDEWKQLETLVLDQMSKAYTFVNDLLTVRSMTALHNPPVQASQKATVTKYVVQPGDSLSKIARKFKVEAGKIQKDNDIRNANVIIPGQVLMIGKTDIALDAKVSISSLPKKESAHIDQVATLERSKEGKGHPLAIIPTDQKRAPWMEVALAEAKQWAGKKEDEITKAANYHKLANPKGGMNSLVGNNHPWCASFVNWCLKKASYEISNSPASSQSFLGDKNFVKIDKPVYGAIVVWTNYVESTGKSDGSGHVGFVYGIDAVLGGNQSDAINFRSLSETKWHDKKKGNILQKIRGFYVPLAYADFAHSQEEQAIPLLGTSPKKLNTEFKMLAAGVKTR